MALAFYFDNTRCTGCRTCEMACIDYKDLTVGRRYRRVIDYEGGETVAADNGDDPDGAGSVTTTAYMYHVSIACNHCTNPACMGVCPTGAMHRNNLGLVCVDTERCIGCGYCTIACPYHAPSIDPVLLQSSKCDGCAERVEAGLSPICVEACPLRALDFGDAEALHAAHPGCEGSILPLPDPSYTAPNLLINVSHAARLAVAHPGEVANYPEIENNIGIGEAMADPHEQQ